MSFPMLQNLAHHHPPVLVGRHDVSGMTDCIREIRIFETHTILTEIMADEFNFSRPEIKNYKAEADADLIPIPGQLELHGRCRCGVLLSTCFCALCVADLIVGMEDLELHYRCKGRSNH